MQKKIYEVPALEVIETEFESMLARSWETEEDDFGGNMGSNEADDQATKKKQYGFNSAPWE